jgi:predicted  nucleic acid-binding Zn-ribbon protein
MKDKTISLRVDIPTYANIITKAHEQGQSLTNFVLDKINLDNASEDIKKMESEIKNLEAKLKAKPKQVVKEVVNDKEIKKLQLELNKAQEQRKKNNDELAEYKKQLSKASGTMAKDVDKIALAESKYKKDVTTLQSRIKSLESANNDVLSDKKKIAQKYVSLKDFVNKLDLRQHSDGYSIGGRMLDSGKNIVVN